jgi:acyl-CoA synthetase (AMP-forming)/AMP-acid ligase II
VGRAADRGGGEEAGAWRSRARNCCKFYEGKIAKWQVPDDVVFVDAIPLGATGKMLKTRLREQLKDYKLPTA